MSDAENEHCCPACGNPFPQPGLARGNDEACFRQYVCGDCGDVDWREVG